MVWGSFGHAVRLIVSEQRDRRCQEQEGRIYRPHVDVSFCIEGFAVFIGFLDGLAESVELEMLEAIR